MLYEKGNEIIRDTEFASFKINISLKVLIKKTDFLIISKTSGQKALDENSSDKRVDSTVQ